MRQHASCWSCVGLLRSHVLPRSRASEGDWVVPSGSDECASSSLLASLFSLSKKDKTHPCANPTNQSQTVPRRKILIASVTHRTLRTTDRFHSRQMRLGTRAGWAGDTARASKVDAVPGTRGRAVGPAVPALAQFTAQFLTRRGPVVSNIVPDFAHVSLDLQFVLLEPRHVQFLSRGTALELAGDVLVVVADNSNLISQQSN